MVLAVIAAGCSGLEPQDTGAEPEDGGGLAEDVVDKVERVVERNTDGHVGGVLALIDTPEAALAVADGLPGEDAERDLAARRAFRVASVTKLVTTAVVLQLVEEGTLDLDDRLPELVPERVDAFEFGDEITLRQLLGHTSGVRDFIRHPDYLPDLVRHAHVSDGVVTGTCEDLGQVEPFDYAAGEASFEPGTDFEYSNSGYLLAGEAIEAVTDAGLEHVFRERILDPLDLQDTWLTCGEEPRAELVRGHHAPGSFGFTIPGQGDEPFDVTDVDDPNLWAAGGLVSTAEDLAVLARALFTGDLFDDDATLETMRETTQNPSYGLGLEIDDGTYGHGGLAAGYGTHLLYDAENDIVVVVMVTETAEDLPGQIAASIMRVLPREERTSRTLDRTSSARIGTNPPLFPHPPIS